MLCMKKKLQVQVLYWFYFDYFQDSFDVDVKASSLTSCWLENFCFRTQPNKPPTNHKVQISESIAPLVHKLKYE